MDKTHSIHRPSLAFIAGAIVGVLGGLIGLGGAEFRLPILITVFALYPHRAVRFNLLVSFVRLVFAAMTRLKIQQIDFTAYADLVLSMTTGGIITAWIGAGLLARVPTARLMAIIAALLLVVALLLFAEATFTGTALHTLPH